MPDHYFTPRLEFGATSDPDWIAQAIEAWEAGSDGQPRILGTNGRPLPPIPKLESGLIEHRWGGFAEGSEAVQYRLRLEVTGPSSRRKVTLGLSFTGPDLPDEETRGGGELVRRLTANWKHRPNEAVFPTRLREVSSPDGVRELFERLLAPNRQTPIVLVTRRSRGEEPVADPVQLHEFLLGMAEVWSLPRTTSTFELGQSFVSRGFDPRWNCYDGGVRLYLPNLDPLTDTLGQHPIVLASRLLSSDDPTLAAATWALGAVCRALGVDEWRARWRDEMVERRGPSMTTMTSSLGDLERLRELHSTLAAEPKLREAEPEPVDAGAAELEPVTEPCDEGRAADLELAVSEPAPIPAPPVAVAPVVEPTEPAAEPSKKRPSTRVQRGLESLRDAFEAFANLEELLQEFQTELESVRAQRDALARERDELSQALQDLEQKLEADDDLELPSTPVGLLAVFQQLGEGRLRITRYARRKAADSRYDDPVLLGRVLSTLLVHGPNFKLVHETLEALVGKQARAKPTESRQTMAKFGNNRKFALDDGTTVTVEQHITLGHGTRNPHGTLQVYWRRGSDGITEIVYVGEHLPTVSVDT